MPLVSKIAFGLFVVGMALYGWATTFRRVKKAPGLGSEGSTLPWRHRDWFTPTGNRLRIVGWLIWTAGTLLLLVGMLLRGHA